MLLTNDVIYTAPEGWDEVMIATRTSALTAAILAIWPVPAEHVGLSASVVSTPASWGEVDLALLVSQGLIQPGTVLVARPAVFKGKTAAIGLDGRIFIGDVVYDTPSAAGAGLNAGGEYKGGINGWRFWKVESSGKSLWDIRHEYRLSLGEESGGDESGEDQQISEQVEAELSAAESVDEVEDV